MTDDVTGPATDRPPRMPRWVKVSAIIVGVLAVLVVVLLLTDTGGDHEPGRHGSAGDGPPAAVAL